MKKSKIKVKKQLAKLPKITKGSQEKNERYKDFPLKHYSYSSFSKICSNPFMFKIGSIQHLNFDSARNVSSYVGNAIHKGLEAFEGGLDEYPVSDISDGIKAGLEVISSFIENTPEGFIKFSTTVATKQKMLELATFGFNAYVTEFGFNDKNEETLDTEALLEEYIDIDNGKHKIHLPIKLKGYLDKVIRLKSNKRISPVDYKTVRSFSNKDKLDGNKIIQAVVYYLLVYSAYGEEPYSMIYREIKLTKNRDGSPQVREYEFVYEEHKLMFDFFFRLYQDVTDTLSTGKMHYLPNINDMFDSELSIIAYTHRLDDEEEVAKQLEEEQVENISSLLRKKLEKKSALGNMFESIKKNFAEAKSINYEKMNNEEKIKTKLMEFGILVTNEGLIKGNSVDMYLIKPAMGVSIKSIKTKSEDIALLLGVEDIRISKQKTNIGIEVPRENRTFPDIKPVNEGFNLTMGVNLMGEVVKKDIREFPHLLIGGSTGSGKSVFMDTIVNQLLGINDAKIVLIDPKGTEFLYLKDYKNVIGYSSDIERTEQILKNAVKEMNTRFETISKIKAKDISMYNKKSESKMNYKFIVIDEFGDLITQDYKVKREKKKTSIRVGVTVTSETQNITEYELNISQEIMKHIQLLSQKARAVGIHLILATQRPSTDVVTGSIKNNFPCKAVFKMSKAVDSQVIMDDAGAEKLLGKGDMLLVSNEGVERLQGLMI